MGHGGKKWMKVLSKDEGFIQGFCFGCLTSVEGYVLLARNRMYMNVWSLDGKWEKVENCSFI